MPASVCLRTTSATAVRMRAASAGPSTGTPSSRANIMRIRSAGRGRLPVWVVRTRSTLRSIGQVLRGGILRGIWVVYRAGSAGPGKERLMPPALILSSDSHVFEPPDLWTTRIDRAFRDRAPRKFGIHIGHMGGPLGEMRKLWKFADAKGFDWFSVSDHFQESPPRGGDMSCYEAIATLTAAAMDTQRI